MIPFTADQPFWGQRVYAIGAGPKPIPVKKLTVENLIAALMDAQMPFICDSANNIGQQLRSESGVDKAVELIESYSNKFHR